MMTRPIPYLTHLDDSQTQINTRHGVFYPTGFIVVVYASADELANAWSASWQHAVADEHQSALNSAQMREICARSDANASTLAQIAEAELKQVDILGQMADQGCEFLIIKDGAINEKRLHEILADFKPVKVLRYGLLTTQELVEEDQAAIVNNPMGQNERNREKASSPG